MAYCFLSVNKPSKKVLQELKRVKLKSILTKGQEIVIDFALPDNIMKEKVRSTAIFNKLLNAKEKGCRSI